MSNTLDVIFSASTVPAEETTVGTSVVVTESPDKGGEPRVYLEGKRLDGARLSPVARSCTHPGGGLVIDGSVLVVGAPDNLVVPIRGQQYTIHKVGMAYAGPLTKVNHDPVTDTIS